MQMDLPTTRRLSTTGYFRGFAGADEGVRPYTFPGGRITPKCRQASNLQADK